MHALRFVICVVLCLIWTMPASAQCAPVELSRRHGYASALAVSGSRVYALGHPGQFIIYNDDLTGTGQLTEAARIDVGVGFDGSIAVVGDYAYVAGRAGMAIYEVSGAGVPQFVQELNQDWIVAQEVVGDRLYVLALSGLRVYDVSDPSAPSLLGSRPDGFSTVSSIRVVDGRVVYSGSLRTTVFDASDPTQITLVADIPFACYESDTIKRMAVASPTTLYEVTLDYSCDIASLRAYDVSETGVVTLLSTTQLPTSYNGVAHARVVGGYLLIPVNDHAQQQSSRLLVFDLSDPAAPALMADVSTGGPMGPVGAVEGDRVYIPANAGGIRVIDISDPNLPTLAANSEYVVVAPDDVTVDHGLAYFADVFGLRVVDVSDRANPVLLGSLDIPGSARTVTHGDGLVCLAFGPGISLDDFPGRIVDVTDPASPVLVGSDLGEAVDIEHIRDRIFALVDSNSYSIIDLSDPSDPVVLAQRPAEGPERIAIERNLMYISGREFTVVDISDLQAPLTIGIGPRADAPGTTGVADIAVSNGVALIARDSPGLMCVDVSDPTAPTLASQLIFADANSVAMSGSTGIVLWDDGRLVSYNTSDPTNLVPIAEIQTLAGYTPSGNSSITLEGDTLFGAIDSFAMGVYSFEGCLPCSDADLLQPYGVLDFTDITLFLAAFSGADQTADLSPPYGTIDFSDVTAFLSAFAAGCP